jgi:hypothetical protein
MIPSDRSNPARRYATLGVRRRFAAFRTCGHESEIDADMQPGEGHKSADLECGRDANKRSWPAAEVPSACKLPREPRQTACAQRR